CPLPDQGLLAAEVRHGIRCRLPRRRGGRDACRLRLRTPGPAHRPRRGGRHGAQEAGGLFLMTAYALLARDLGTVDAPRARARVQARAEAPHQAPDTAGSLNVLTCGSVDD